MNKPVFSFLPKRLLKLVPVVLLGLLSGLMSNVVGAEELGMLTADGFGTADSAKFPGPRAKLLARRAGTVDAQRNLLEVIDGVRITSGTTVKDMMLASDVIGSRVKGMVQGAFKVSENLYEEEGVWVAEVKMGICLNASPVACRKRPTLTSLLQPELPKPAEEEKFAPDAAAPPPQVVKSQEAKVVATGLVVDLSGLNFAPVLDLRVQTPGGKELYGPGHVDPGTDWLHWATSVESASAMADIVGSAPLIVRASARGESGQVIVSEDAAVNIFGQNLAGGDFLRGGKVVLVVN